MPKPGWLFDCEKRRKFMKKSTIIRLAALVAALLNQALVTLGFDALPWSGDAIGEGVSTILTVCTAGWAYWRNNSHTPEAVTSDKVMKLLKDGAITAVEIDGVLKGLSQND
jgi:SPP1 family holin